MIDCCVNYMTRNIDIYDGHTIREICVGDRFYHNNFSTRIQAALPDYLIITDILPFPGEPHHFHIKAKYENHAIGPHERMLSDDILRDSNLDDSIKTPEWIFVKEVKA